MLERLAALMTRSRWPLFAAAILSVPLYAGCGPVYVERPAVIVEEPPPPPRIEVVPVAPAPAHVWVPGRWAWRAGPKRYVWVPGRWRVIRHPHHRHWVPGHWRSAPGGWTWMPGHWR